MITFGDISIPISDSPTGKQPVNVDIILNDITYHWIAWVPPLYNQTLTDYLLANAQSYEDEILRKEAIWAVTPRTKTIIDPITLEEVTVDVNKDEVVFPSPDIQGMRELAYKAESDSLYMAWQKYTALGELDKAALSKTQWLDKVNEINVRIPYQ